MCLRARKDRDKCNERKGKDRETKVFNMKIKVKENMFKGK